MKLTFDAFVAAMESVPDADRRVVARAIRATAGALGIKDVVAEQMDKELVRANDLAWEHASHAEELREAMKEAEHMANAARGEISRLVSIRNLIN